MVFHPAIGLDNAAIDQVQAAARKRILRASFTGRSLIEAHDAKEMVGYTHGGDFSVDAGGGLRPWRALQPSRVTGRCILGADLQKPGITVRKTVVFMTDQGAILGMMRLNFLSVSVGLKSHIP